VFKLGIAFERSKDKIRVRVQQYGMHGFELYECLWLVIIVVCPWCYTRSWEAHRSRAIVNAWWYGSSRAVMQTETHRLDFDSSHDLSMAPTIDWACPSMVSGQLVSWLEAGVWRQMSGDGSAPLSAVGGSAAAWRRCMARCHQWLTTDDAPASGRAHCYAVKML